MKSLLLVCFVGQVLSQHNGGINLPHGHDLTLLVDGAFNRIDQLPKDGEVTTAEYDRIMTHEDDNNDSCVTIDEFKAHAVNPNFHDVREKIYQHFDPDGDNCITIDELNAEFHHIDHNGDGLIEKHEFEHYYTQLLKHLYGPSHGGARK